MKLIDLVYKMINAPSEIRHIQLVGQGGSSKTYQMLDAYTKLSDNEYNIPLYIPLTETVTRSGFSIFRFIEKYYLNVKTEYDVDLMSKRMIEMFTHNEQYQFVLLLDAYNEVVNNFEFRTDNHGINLEIQELNKLPNVKIIVSTRYELTGVTFGDYLIAEMDPLTQEQIDYFLPNRTSHEEQLVGLLRLPFYMNLYLKLRKEKDIDTSKEPITTEGELLNYYYLTYLPKKFSSENRLDQENQHFEQLLFCLQDLLPRISYFMHQNNTSHITEDQIDACFMTIDNLHAKSWSVMDLIRSIVPTGIMYKADNADDEISYAFSHEHIKDFFLALLWIYETNKEIISSDIYDLLLPEQVLGFIGDIVREYTYLWKYDKITAHSPIETILDKNRGKFGDNKIRVFNSTCIEILKMARCGEITADFSNLDLTYCDFTKCKCRNCSFVNSISRKNTFVCENDIATKSDKFYRMWSDKSILISINDECIIFAYSVVAKAQMYQMDLGDVLSEPQLKCILQDVYIDSSQIIMFVFNCVFAAVIVLDTNTGKLTSVFETRNLNRNTKLLLKPFSKLYSKTKNKIDTTIRLVDAHSTAERIAFDKTNSLFCRLQDGNIDFYSVEYKYIGSISLESEINEQLFFSYSSNESFIQNGWYITLSDTLEEIYFFQLQKNKKRISVFRKIVIPTKTKDIISVHITDDKTTAIIILRNTDAVIVDLSTNHFELTTKPDELIKRELKKSELFNSTQNKQIRAFGIANDIYLIYYCQFEVKERVASKEAAAFDKFLKFLENVMGDGQRLASKNKVTVDKLFLINFKDWSYRFADVPSHFDCKSVSMIGIKNDILFEKMGEYTLLDQNGEKYCFSIESNSIQPIITNMFFDESNLCLIVNDIINNSNNCIVCNTKKVQNWEYLSINNTVSVFGFSFADSKLYYINTRYGIAVLVSQISHELAIVCSLEDGKNNCELYTIDNLYELQPSIIRKQISKTDNSAKKIFNDIYSELSLEDVENMYIKGQIDLGSFKFLDGKLYYCYRFYSSKIVLLQLDLENETILEQLSTVTNHALIESSSNQIIALQKYDMLRYTGTDFVKKYNPLIEFLSGSENICEISIDDIPEKNKPIKNEADYERIRIDLSEVKDKHRITGICYSEKDAILAMLDESNNLYFYSIFNENGSICNRLINKLHIMLSANYLGSDFANLRIIDDINGNAKKILQDNGGVIT